MILLQVIEESIGSDGFQAVWKVISKISMRLFIDLLSVATMVGLIYYPNYKNRELFFTFFIFNIIIFFISFLLNKVDLSMGAAFGLFAVFSMLRYRTEDISIKDMTYLFLTIAIGLICAVTKVKDASDFFEYVFLIILNAMILLVTYILESKSIMKKESVKIILYENIELIRSQNKEALLEDIRNRTGMPVHRVSIQRIDFLRDAAQIKIYFYED